MFLSITLRGLSCLSCSIRMRVKGAKRSWPLIYFDLEIFISFCGFLRSWRDFLVPFLLFFVAVRKLTYPAPKILDDPFFFVCVYVCMWYLYLVKLATLAPQSVAGPHSHRAENYFQSLLPLTISWCAPIIFARRFCCCCCYWFAFRSSSIPVRSDADESNRKFLLKFLLPFRILFRRVDAIGKKKWCLKSMLRLKVTFSLRVGNCGASCASTLTPQFLPTLSW